MHLGMQMYILLKLHSHPPVINPALLIGEDTDLLVLLLHYAHTDNKELHFRLDNTSKAMKVSNINRLIAILPKELCSQLLFIHAYTGCDSTSRIFGIGKKSAF